MATFNKVILIGNLTKDPESRFIPSGQQVASFSIAVNKKYKTAAGEQKEEVSFFDCEAWGKTAELVTSYLKKGRAVHLEGSLKQERWETPEGQKRNKVKIVVQSVQFLGQKPEEEGQGGAAPAAAGSWDGGEDVPF